MNLNLATRMNRAKRAAVKWVRNDLVDDTIIGLLPFTYSPFAVIDYLVKPFRDQFDLDLVQNMTTLDGPLSRQEVVNAIDAVEPLTGGGTCLGWAVDEGLNVSISSHVRDLTRDRNYN